MPKTIKDLPEHSRPREKLREKGAASLTDEEWLPRFSEWARQASMSAQWRDK